MSPAGSERAGWPEGRLPSNAHEKAPRIRLGYRITQVLAEDLRVMSGLARRAGRTTDHAEGEFLWSEFVQMAGSHFLALETIIVPALHQRGAAHRVADLSVAIDAAQNVLSEVLTTSQNNDEYPQRLARLVGAMQQLHDRDGARLAITLTECLDDGALRLLGVECEHFLSLRRLQISARPADLTDRLDVRRKQKAHG
jgi:hypothetical protein